MLRLPGGTDARRQLREHAVQQRERGFGQNRKGKTAVPRARKRNQAGKGVASPGVDFTTPDTELTGGLADKAAIDERKRAARHRGRAARTQGGARPEGPDVGGVRRV